MREFLQGQDDHKTILSSLHWLPIKFQSLILTYKALNCLAPVYLMDLLSPYNPSHSLRSLN